MTTSKQWSISREGLEGQECMCDSYFFFFSSRRRHTRCSRDWSSDVCSSDLLFPFLPEAIHTAIVAPDYDFSFHHRRRTADRFADFVRPKLFARRHGNNIEPAKIGRASCRERV